MINNHNFRTGLYQQKSDDGKALFRINVAKKINLLNRKHDDEDLSEEDQKEKDFIVSQDNSSIKVESPQKQ